MIQEKTKNRILQSGRLIKSVNVIINDVPVISEEDYSSDSVSASQQSVQKSQKSKQILPNVESEKL